MTDPVQALADMRATAIKGEVAGNWNDVVATYKRAGQQVTVVGPAIDQLSGGNPQTATLTHRAWSNNGLLQDLNSSPSATKDDADAAKRFVDSMLADLQVALNIAKASPHRDPFVAAASAIAHPGYSPPPHVPPPFVAAASAIAHPGYSPPPYVPLPQTPPVPQPQERHRLGDVRDVKRYGPAAIGVAVGFSVAGPVGAAIGCVVGLGLGSLLAEDSQ
jgi:hypothetical protein